MKKRDSDKNSMNRFDLLKKVNFDTEKNQWLYKKTTSEKVVLFCSHDLRSQGAQNSLFELAIGLRRLYNIHPIVYSSSNGPLEDKYKTYGIKVIIDNSFKTDINDESYWERHIRDFGLKLKRLNCDLVIANTLQTFYMVHVADSVKLPTIFIPRESEQPETYFNYLPELIRRKAYNTIQKASQIVFVANATKKQWNFLNKWRFLNNCNTFKVIHNSLNTSLLNQDSIYSREEIRKNYNVKEDDIVLLSLGTVAPRKGQLDFVKSLPEIFNKSVKPIKAFIVGISPFKGEETEAYNLAIYELIESFPIHIRKNIVLIPETDTQSFTKPYDFYTIADIFVFTSRIESFPRVILEALYFGLPIVTTPCFGVVEQCIENYNSYYYDKEDIKSLSSNILKLINNDNLRKKFAEASKKLFQHLQTYDQMIQNYYYIIEDLINKDI